MGLSQKDQTKHNTLLPLGTQSIKIEDYTVRSNKKRSVEGGSLFYISKIPLFSYIWLH